MLTALIHGRFETWQNFLPLFSICLSITQLLCLLMSTTYDNILFHIWHHCRKQPAASLTAAYVFDHQLGPWATSDWLSSPPCCLYMSCLFIPDWLLFLLPEIPMSVLTVRTEIVDAFPSFWHLAFLKIYLYQINITQTKNSLKNNSKPVEEYKCTVI